MSWGCDGERPVVSQGAVVVGPAVKILYQLDGCCISIY